MAPIREVATLSSTGVRWRALPPHGAPQTEEQASISRIDAAAPAGD